MDEILLLQQQLMAVQNSSTAYKLANRNVMEIVDMLIKKQGLVLFFTLDGTRSSAGREFITPQFLDNSIKETVAEMGKISLLELAKLLNIDVSIVEQRVDLLTRSTSLQNVAAAHAGRRLADRPELHGQAGRAGQRRAAAQERAQHRRHRKQVRAAARLSDRGTLFSSRKSWAGSAR